MSISHTFITILIVWLGTAATLYYLRNLTHKLLFAFSNYLPQDKRSGNVYELEALDYIPIGECHPPTVLTGCETELTSVCAETSEVVTSLVENASVAGEHLITGLIESI